MSHFISFLLNKIAHTTAKFFRHAARQETISQIGGVHPRALSPRRWGRQDGMGHFPFSPAAPKFFGRTARRLSPQSGRSMIEMLAVLAIMGVLTVGGIAAYSFAVSKHRANQIYNQVDLRAVASFGNPFVRQTQVGQTYPLPGFDEVVENITYQHQKTSGNGYDIIASHVPERVCRRLQDMTFPVPKSVTLNEADLSSTCGADNTFVFHYDGLSVGKPSSGVTPIDCNCSGCQSCESGTCQDNDNLCGPKEVCVAGSCQCASGYEECGGSCYATCGEGYMRDPVTCDCVCEPQECPEHASWDTTTCSCVCEDGYDMCGGSCHPVCNSSGMTGERDPNTCACTCIEGTNADTCACPAGYIYVNGQCQRFECSGGTTGFTFDCYINDAQCGRLCSSDGSVCLQGACHPETCEGNGEYTLKKYGGCSNKEKYCMPLFYEDGSINYWRCYNDYGDCCDASSFGVCKNGSCYDNPCSEYSSATYEPVNAWYLYGCRFNSNLSCYLNNEARTQWNCFVNGVLCSAKCTDPLNCAGCDYTNCPDGSTYDTATGMCTKGGVYCDNTGCYFDAQKSQRCGETCGATGFGICAEGTCFNTCPTGFSLAYSSLRDYGACVKGNLVCFNSSANAPAMCYYQDQICGNQCELDGTNCEIVFLPQCASGGKCVYGYQITVDCECDTDPNATIGDYCCAPGHTFTNGGCTLIDCPAGQIADENGICQTECENNAEVISTGSDTCVCGGNIYKDNFNRTICCDADHSWDETSETCV